MWAWHWGTGEALGPRWAHAHQVALSEEERALKARAVEAFVSQVAPVGPAARRPGRAPARGPRPLRARPSRSSSSRRRPGGDPRPGLLRRALGRRRRPVAHRRPLVRAAQARPAHGRAAVASGSGAGWRSGCAAGHLTERLAGRCGSLLACDVDPRARRAHPRSGCGPRATRPPGRSWSSSGGCRGTGPTAASTSSCCPRSRTTWTRTTSPSWSGAPSPRSGPTGPSCRATGATRPRATRAPRPGCARRVAAAGPGPGGRPRRARPAARRVDRGRAVGRPRRGLAGVRTGPDPARGGGGVPAVRHVGVLVPVRDEEDLLPGLPGRAAAARCEHLRAARPDVAVRVVVVLDGCTDGSAEVVRRAPWPGRVGPGRAADDRPGRRGRPGGGGGPAAAVGGGRRRGPRRPRGWRAPTPTRRSPRAGCDAQVEAADAGADAWVGTVELGTATRPARCGHAWRPGGPRTSATTRTTTTSTGPTSGCAARPTSPPAATRPC